MRRESEWGDENGAANDDGANDDSNFDDDDDDGGASDDTVNDALNIATALRYWRSIARFLVLLI